MALTSPAAPATRAAGPVRELAVTSRGARGAILLSAYIVTLNAFFYKIKSLIVILFL